MNSLTKVDLTAKATEYFADTISEFMTTLDGETIYKCFVVAAKQIHEHAEKEYVFTKALMDAIEGNNK